MSVCWNFNFVVQSLVLKSSPIFAFSLFFVLAVLSGNATLLFCWKTIILHILNFAHANKICLLSYQVKIVYLASVFSWLSFLVFALDLQGELCLCFLVITRNDKNSAPVIRRVSSQSGSLNRGMQSWGTGPPPLPREPPPQEEPTPSPQPKTPK